MTEIVSYQIGPWFVWKIKPDQWVVTDYSPAKGRKPHLEPYLRRYTSEAEAQEMARLLVATDH